MLVAELCGQAFMLSKNKQLVQDSRLRLRIIEESSFLHPFLEFDRQAGCFQYSSSVALSRDIDWFRCIQDSFPPNPVLAPFNCSTVDQIHLAAKHD